MIVRLVSFHFDLQRTWNFLSRFDLGCIQNSAFPEKGSLQSDTVKAFRDRIALIVCQIPEIFQMAGGRGCAADRVQLILRQRLRL